MAIRAVVFEDEVRQAISDRLRVIREQAVRPEETIFLDDSAPNITAACAVGIHGIHYRDNAQVIAEIEELLTPDGD